MRATTSYQTETASEHSMLRSGSTDFQSRFDFPPRSADGSAIDCILLATRAHDSEADELSLRLAARGVAMVRLDSDRLSDVRVSVEPVGLRLELPPRTFRPRLAWRRFWSPWSIRTHADSTIADRFQRDTWSAMVEGCLSHPALRRLNAAAANGGPPRLWQLGRAASLGLRIPRTVVSTDPSCATRISRRPSCQVVLKPLHEHFVEAPDAMLHAMFPQVLSVGEVCDIRFPQVAPFIVQEFVEPDAEIRAYLVGEELFAYRVAEHRPDQLFERSNGVPVTPVPVPATIEHSVRRFVAGQGMDVVAFDFIQQGADFYFLEVNVTGDWLFYERAAGDRRVSDAVEELLCREFVHG